MYLLNMLATSYRYSIDYDSSDLVTDTAAAGGIMAIIMGMFAVIMLPALIITVISVIAQWKIFTKAGEAGWKSIIPIYNTVTLLQIVKINPLFILTAFIPVVGGVFILFVTIMSMIRLSQGFGKGSGFAVGLILLSFIFQCILAFDKSTWDPSKIDTSSMSFLNTKDAANAAAPAAPSAPTATPENPWVNGQQQ